MNKIECGDVFKLAGGGSVTVIEYIDSKNIIIKHNDYNAHESVVNSRNLRAGEVKNPFKKSVYEIGFIGSGKYKARENGVLTDAYSSWRAMLLRCYHEKFQSLHKTYIGCSVVSEWHNFQNFAEWFYKQKRSDNFQLDKDIIVRGNRVYGPETSCLIHRELNALCSSPKRTNNSLPPGVRAENKKYRARLYYDGEDRSLGLYSTPEDAFLAYKEAKEARVKYLAKLYKDEMNPRVYDALMSYELSVND